MATFEIVALDPTTPQLRAPGAADTYSLPRPIVGDNIFAQIVDTTATSYTVSDADSGELLRVNAGSSATVTFPTSIISQAGFRMWVANVSSANQTVALTPQAGTIDGAAQYVLRRGEAVQIITDGTNIYSLSGRRLRFVSENFTSQLGRPQATGDNSLAIGYGAQSTATSGVSIGNSATASGTNSSSLGFSSTSGGTNSVAIGSYAYGAVTGANAFGYYAYAGGAYSNGIGANSAGSGANATANGSFAAGGVNASGQDSFAAANSSNSSTYGSKASNAVAMGLYSTAGHTHGFALGGYSTTGGSQGISFGYSASSGSYGISIGVSTTSISGGVAIGSGWSFNGANASGTSAVAIGDGAASSGTFAVAIGPCANTRGNNGRHTYGNGRFAVSGDSQANKFILRRETVNANPGPITSDNTGSNFQNEVQLVSNSAMAFSGTIVARQQAATGSQSAAWKIEGLIRMEGSNASTTLVTSAVTAISNVPGWTVALSADTTYGCLRISVTGALSTNIRWVGNIDTAEVVYG